MSWWRHDGCHFVSFVIYISGAKFKEHCFNISRDILDWVLNCFSGTTYDVITFNTNTWISLKRKKIFQKGKHHSSLLWKALQISSNYFLLHRHFKIHSDQAKEDKADLNWSGQILSNITYCKMQKKSTFFAHPLWSITPCFYTLLGN